MVLKYLIHKGTQKIWSEDFLEIIMTNRISPIEWNNVRFLPVTTTMVIIILLRELEIIINSKHELSNCYLCSKSKSPVNERHDSLKYCTYLLYY